MTREEMFERGILKKGREIQLIGRPETRATIIDAKKVNYGGDIKTYTKWILDITGWKGVNIFKTTELVSGGRLSTLRETGSQ